VTEAVPWLLLWGALVGLDLVSVPQVMIARPLVAGTVAGWLAGDPLAGGVAGTLLELFALDVLPVGASRYPDYGLGAVAAAAAVAGAPLELGLGVALGVGLLGAYLAGEAMNLVRRFNDADLRRHLAAVQAGDRGAIAAVHYRGLARDAARAVSVTALGLAAATFARGAHLPAGAATLMTVAGIGAGLAGAAAGTMRLAGRGLDLRWFALGLGAGTAWVVLA
jgi:PTS system mannose-specific IIC component